MPQSLIIFTYTSYPFFSKKMPFQIFFVLLQLFPVSVSVVGTWCESVRTMQVGHMFNLMDFYRK